MKLLERLKAFRPDVLTVILLVAIVYIWFRPPARVTDMDRPISGLHLTTLSGQTLTMASLKGKVVLVNFWATWCPYCKKEMPALEKFYQAYRDQGFEIVAVSTDDDPATVQQFLAERDYHFPVAMHGPGIGSGFSGIKSLPTSFILDKEGRIRHRIDGQVYYGRLEDLVLPLLAL